MNVCVCVCDCLWVCTHGYSCLQRLEVPDLPGVGVAGDCTFPTQMLGTKYGPPARAVQVLYQKATTLTPKINH